MAIEKGTNVISFDFDTDKQDNEDREENVTKSSTVTDELIFGEFNKSSKDVEDTKVDELGAVQESKSVNSSSGSVSDIDSANSLFTDVEEDDSSKDSAETEDNSDNIVSFTFRDDSDNSADEIPVESKIINEPESFIIPDEIILKNSEEIDEKTGKDAKNVDNEVKQPSESTDTEADTMTNLVKTKSLPHWPHEKTKPLSIAEDMKYTLLSSSFKKGRLIQLPDKSGKPYMLFYQKGNELMAYKYLGADSEVVIPAVVAKVPVKHIHSDFLTDGSVFGGAVNTVRNVVTVAKSSPVDISGNLISNASRGVSKLVLPEGLVEIPPKLFYYCLNLKSIVIPSTVRDISARAFSDCVIKDIYFNGDVPRNFNRCKTDHDIIIHVRGR